MKVRVKRDFRDRYTGEIYRAGQVIEVDEGRYREINSTAFGQLVEPVESKARRRKKSG